MKKFGFIFVCLAVFGFLSFATGRYIARKINWRHELKYLSYVNSPASWMQEQIREDLSSVLPRSISSDKFDAILKEQYEKGDPFLLARYTIRNNRLYTTYFNEEKKHPRAPIVEKAIQEILSVVKVPDVDWLMSLGEAGDGWKYDVPVFAFAKNASLEENVILMPDFEALEGHTQIMKDLSKGKKEYPWDQKHPKAFWRGAMTGTFFTAQNFLEPPRSCLITVSKEQPDLVDAKYSFLTQTNEPEIIRALFADYFGPEAKIKDHLAFKYQVLVDGNSCAYSRAYWQLFSNCLMFRQESNNIQWFYRALEPNVHYIPVREDFKDLAEKIDWARHHDDEAQQIAKNALKFARKNLSKSDIRYYMVLLLKEYAKIQNAENAI